MLAGGGSKALHQHGPLSIQSNHLQDFFIKSPFARSPNPNQCSPNNHFSKSCPQEIQYCQMAQAGKYSKSNITIGK
jgi:hypothetical protein